MPKFREFVFGPWRAVTVLGVTQILAWGALFYPPVLMMPLIAAERGWSLVFAMGGFSLGLLVAGFCAPTVGGLIDRHGGHVVMSAGALLGALGLVCLTLASHPAAYLATWVILGVAHLGDTLRSGFCDARADLRAAARKPITALTLAGGFASTVSWPATQFFLSWTDWQTTYLIFAALAGAGRGAAARIPAAPHARRGAKSISTPMSRCRRRRCRRAGCPSFWSPPHSLLTPSCRPGSPRIFWRCSAAPASIPRPSF